MNVALLLLICATFVIVAAASGPKKNGTAAHKKSANKTAKAGPPAASKAKNRVATPEFLSRDPQALCIRKEMQDALEVYCVPNKRPHTCEREAVYSLHLQDAQLRKCQLNLEDRTGSE